MIIKIFRPFLYLNIGDNVKIHTYTILYIVCTYIHTYIYKHIHVHIYLFQSGKTITTTRKTKANKYSKRVEEESDEVVSLFLQKQHLQAPTHSKLFMYSNVVCAHVCVHSHTDSFPADFELVLCLEFVLLVVVLLCFFLHAIR